MNDYILSNDEMQFYPNRSIRPLFRIFEVILLAGLMFLTWSHINTEHFRMTDAVPWLCMMSVPLLLFYAAGDRSLNVMLPSGTYVLRTGFNLFPRYLKENIIQFDRIRVFASGQNAGRSYSIVLRWQNPKTKKFVLYVSYDREQTMTLAKEVATRLGLRLEDETNDFGQKY